MTMLRGGKVARPGRRGAFLILFGLIWTAIGYGALTVELTHVQRVGLAPLISIAGGYQHLAYGWIAAGAIAVVFAFLQSCDRWGFYAIMLPVILYAGSYAVTTISNDIPTGFIAACVYAALAAAVGIVAGWPDPIPTNDDHPEPPVIHLASGVVLLAAAQAVSVDQDTIEKIVVALIGLGGIIYTRRSARAADARKVDAQAYARAQEINEASFGRLEGEVTALKEDLGEEKAAHRVTQERLREALEERDKLRDQIRDLDTRLTRLARIIHASGMELPPEYDERVGGHLEAVDEPKHQGN